MHALKNKNQYSTLSTSITESRGPLPAQGIGLRTAIKMTSANKLSIANNLAKNRKNYSTP